MKTSKVLSKFILVLTVLAFTAPLSPAFARGGQEEVPSPTFTLVQVYEIGSVAIWHFDLYRLKSPEEAWELGIEDAFSEGISLIEWPERLGPLLPRRRLEIEFLFGDQPDSRRALIAAGEGWQKRLAAITADA